MSCLNALEWFGLCLTHFRSIVLSTEAHETDDHCISCVSGDKEQNYKKWHVFSGSPILLQKSKALTHTLPPPRRQSTEGPAAPANLTAGQRAWWQTLSNGGAVRDIRFEDDTEMTLRKHAVAKNKHVCEVRLKAP